MNFRQDFRYYTVREYALMIVAALSVGVMLAVLLNAVGGGPPAGQTTLLKASRAERAPATNFAVASYDRRERAADAALAHRRAVRAARHQRFVEARRNARAARARAVVARATPRRSSTTPQRQVTVVQPRIAPQPVSRPAPRPAPAPTRSAEKKGGGTLQFDDSG